MAEEANVECVGNEESFTAKYFESRDGRRRRGGARFS